MMRTAIRVAIRVGGKVHNMFFQLMLLMSDMRVCQPADDYAYA